MRKPQSRPMTRRRLIGTALAGTALARTAVPSAGWAQTTAPARKEDRMTVRFAFNGQTFTAVLHDNPTARDFASQLPLDLTISDYSTNEKIAYLPRKLTERDSGPFTGEAPGDLCYYAPWGNLVMYYAGYRYSRGLIRLGRIEGGIAPLLVRGEFPLRIDRLS